MKKFLLALACLAGLTVTADAARVRVVVRGGGSANVAVAVGQPVHVFRPVVVARPVFVAPAPVFVAPGLGLGGCGAVAVPFGGLGLGY